MPRRLPLLLLVAPLAVALSTAALSTAAAAQVPDSLRTFDAPQTAVSLGDPTSRPGAPPADDGPPILLPVPAAPAAPGGLERPVSYTARDSLRIVIAPRDSTDDGPGDVVSLFGGVEASYEGATITAGRVDYESRNQALRAAPLAGDTSSVPRFSGDEGAFTGQGFVYNLRTQRGRITAARTAIQDGYLLGGIIKQQDAHVVFAQDAAYTTCTLDHPHYALEAGRIKIVDGKKVYTGPVRLTLLGIPMPVILPFGYFPAAQGRRSGPLAVDYGQDTNYGLFLGNVGWYWAISDYLDAQVATKLGTAGSFQLSSAVAYNRRYAYNGRVSLDIGRIRSGESTDPGFAPRIPFGLRWGHNQTLPTGQRLTASVDLQSESRRQAVEEVSNQIRSTTSSSVAYSQQWPSVGRSLTVSAQASQDFVNNRTQAQLPQVLFNQQRRFPFRRGRDDRWYEKISLEYNADARNGFDYTAQGDSTVGVLEALTSADAFRRGACPPGDPACSLTQFDYRVVQRVPISATFSVPRFNLNLSPSVSYVETWANEAVVQRYDPLAGVAVASTEPGFTAVRQATVSAAASTEFVGTFPIRIGSLDGIRHTVSPQVSLNYQPDYQSFGFVREVQTDSLGSTRRYAIVPSTTPISPTRSMTFSVQNAFVARTVRTDSTGAEQQQTRQVLSVSLNGGYNFADDRRPFQDLSTAFTTQFYGFNASGSAQLSAYAPDTASAALRPLTYFDATGRPLRVTRAGFQVSRSFQSGRTTGPSDVRPVAAPLAGAVPNGVAAPDYDPTLGAPRSATVGYLDYSAPWSFSAGLSVNTSAGNGIAPGRTTAAIDVNQFRARLTPKWAVTGSTGFDLMTQKITQSRIALTRDLHCWEMSINWQPIGQTKLFAVSLYVKGGFLRDLLRLDVPNSTVRSQGFGRQIGGLPGFR